MQQQGNTILLTGGGSGIGRGLARAFAANDNHVIVAGRRREALEETARGSDNITPYVLDVADAADVQRGARELVARFPKLNVLFNNAGIMRAEDLTAETVSVDVAEATVQTNLMGPIRLTAALLPHLRRQQNAVIVNVTSGLAFVPLALTATYCATKAALHSYTQSLRHQLRTSGVEVIEVAPPYVATDLMDGKEDPAAMDLDAFLAQTMEIFARAPTPEEVAVDRVLGLRNAEREGRFAATFTGLNAAREARRAEVARR